MRRLSWLAILGACGGSSVESPRTVPSNTVTPTPVRADPTVLLEAREVVDGVSGVTRLVWLQPERARGIDPDHPCCGLSYDGNRYDDQLATCAVVADECGAGRTAVYPGLADDPVCGERRRCVPLPTARVIVADATTVRAADGDDAQLAIGGGDVAHREVEVGQSGFLWLTVAGRMELVALDYGSRYTILVRGGRIERVTRD